MSLKNTKKWKLRCDNGRKTGNARRRVECWGIITYTGRCVLVRGGVGCFDLCFEGKKTAANAIRGCFFVCLNVVGSQSGDFAILA